MNVVLVAKYYVKPGHADDVAKLLTQMAERVSSDEPSCLLYRVNRASEVDNLFLLYEVYEDEQALAAHRGTAHYIELVEGKIVPLLDKRERELYVPVLP